MSSLTATKVLDFLVIFIPKREMLLWDVQLRQRERGSQINCRQEPRLWRIQRFVPSLLWRPQVFWNANILSHFFLSLLKKNQKLISAVGIVSTFFIRNRQRTSTMWRKMCTVECHRHARFAGNSLIIVGLMKHAPILPATAVVNGQTSSTSQAFTFLLENIGHFFMPSNCWQSSFQGLSPQSIDALWRSLNQFWQNFFVLSLVVSVNITDSKLCDSCMPRTSTCHITCLSSPKMNTVSLEKVSLP